MLSRYITYAPPAPNKIFLAPSGRKQTWDISCPLVRNVQKIHRLPSRSAVAPPIGWIRLHLRCPLTPEGAATEVAQQQQPEERHERYCRASRRPVGAHRAGCTGHRDRRRRPLSASSAAPGRAEGDGGGYGLGCRRDLVLEPLPRRQVRF